MKEKNRKLGLIICLCVLIVLLLAMIGLLIISSTSEEGPSETVYQEEKLPAEKIESEQTKQSVEKEETYNPQINPIDFVSEIDNKYLAYSPGKKFVYEGETEEGTEHIEVYVTQDTKMVMGVNTIVVWDRVWLDGELIEDTKDWFAQDKDGNVWYFGEESKELVNNKVVSTEGSWEAGVDGALPGIILPAVPKVGEIYRQEYYEGEAEDMAEVVALSEDIKVKYGEFTNCLLTKEWNPLEPGDEEYKYYCPQVGGVVYEAMLTGEEEVQLISFETDGQPTEASQEPPEEMTTEITREQAIEIAMAEVEGKVTEVGIEKKYGKPTWVVEMTYGGEETDVIIDIETGEVLGFET